jgi:hypothetical protein
MNQQNPKYYSSPLENYALRKLAHITAGQEDGAIERAREFLIEQALLEGNKNKTVKEIAERDLSILLLF